MKKKMTKVILKVFLIIFLSGNLFASDIKDDDYKFEITLPPVGVNLKFRS